jgi:hypothetical protein
MAEHLTASAVRGQIGSAELSEGEAFGLLADVAALLADPDTSEGAGRDLVIRLLERQDELAPYEEFLTGLVRRVGLFPYLTTAELGDADLLAREYHRPIGQHVEDLVFHTEQARAYQRLLDGENLILSASTSFGKSLLIDALLATGYYANAVVVVPTIALLDETRRRLSRFDYKVITHASQRPADRNVFVMTQERLLDYPDLPGIDFFAIDEFYKLDPSADPDRAALLNQAFYRLLKTGAQFFLLGPNVHAIPDGLDIDAAFVQTSYRTVAVDVIRVPSAGTDRQRLIDLCRGLTEPTIVFCKSPARTREVASWFLDEGLTARDDRSEEAGEWAADAYDPEWLVSRALREGVGIHHGRLPRALAHLIVELFNGGNLRFLICTSTLIEGVNTAAKNVVVFDNRIAAKRIDFFTYRNIRGRSGRMFRHFVGRVFLFHAPPTNELPSVDIPALTQGEDASPGLLLNLDPEDLTPRSRQRIAPYFNDPLLTADVLRENVGVDLDAQVRVARRIRETWLQIRRLAGWRGLPTYEQWEATCELLWDLASGDGRSGAVRTYRQLAFLTWRLRDVRGDVRRFVRLQASAQREPSDTVEDSLEFVRTWPGHHLPKLLRALQRIEEAALSDSPFTPGDYRLFATQAEHLFMAPFAAALEEYGIPSGVSIKLPELFRNAADLDEVLARLKRTRLGAYGLSQFEQSLVSGAVDSI